jgi:hypothetical protein
MTSRCLKDLRRAIQLVGEIRTLSIELLEDVHGTELASGWPAWWDSDAGQEVCEKIADFVNATRGLREDVLVISGEVHRIASHAVS